MSGPRVAILLCAGYGTRLGALTAEIPKPLLPVAGKPVLDYLMEELLRLPRLAAVHVASNARYARRFEAWAGDWRRRLPREFAVEVHDDGSRENAERLGAVGDLAFVLERLADRGAFPAGALVASGDNVYRFSLLALWQAFLAGGESRVLALREPDPAKLRRTGVLELATGGRVVRLWEKPAEPPSEWACPSLYCFAASALARVAPYLEAGLPRDETGRFVAHLVEREAVHAVEAAGERLHVGSPEAYRRADEILRRDPPRPRPRQVLGILGGLGPHAHLDLERKLLGAARELAGAVEDQDFPEWIVASVPQTPDRSAAIRGDAPSALPWLLHGLRRLEPHVSATGEAVAGADFAIVACNSAHHYLDDLRHASALPLLDLIDECARHAAGRLAPGDRVGLLATSGTLESGLYHRALAERGLEPRSLLDAADGDARQERLVMEAIYGRRDGSLEGLKTGGASEAARQLLLAAAGVLVRELGCRALVAACTEVPLALTEPEVAGVPLFDSAEIVARAAIRRIYGLETG